MEEQKEKEKEPQLRPASWEEPGGEEWDENNQSWWQDNWQTGWQNDGWQQEWQGWQSEDEEKWGTWDGEKPKSQHGDEDVEEIEEECHIPYQIWSDDLEDWVVNPEYLNARRARQDQKK